jgi:hypothetical protein
MAAHAVAVGLVEAMAAAVDGADNHWLILSKVFTTK